MYMNVLGEHGEPAAEPQSTAVRGGMHVSPKVLRGEGRQLQGTVGQHAAETHQWTCHAVVWEQPVQLRDKIHFISLDLLIYLSVLPKVLR